MNLRSRKILVVFLTLFVVVSIHPSSFHPFASSSSSVVEQAFSVPLSRGATRPSHGSLAWRRGSDGIDGSLFSRCQRPAQTVANGPCGRRPSLTQTRVADARGRCCDGNEHGCLTNTALFATGGRRRRPPSPDEDEGDERQPPKFEVVSSSSDEDDDDQDWISDRELIRRAANAPGGERLTNRDRFTLEKFRSSGIVTDEDFADEENAILYSDDAGERTKQKQTGGAGGGQGSVYSDEEEDLIRAMGGKTDRRRRGSSTPSSSSGPTPPSYDDGPYFDTDDRGAGDESSNGRGSTQMREEGYLGDSTLEEISRDYSVPICYLADVMVTWGCTPPIDPCDRLGDLVTGEQAFSLLEALLTLDTGSLNDRYSYDDLTTVCDENDVELRDAFEFCVKEGYNLPFGVRTCLRVEQEEELLRALGSGGDFEYDYDHTDEGGYYEDD